MALRFEFCHWILFWCCASHDRVAELPTVTLYSEGGAAIVTPCLKCPTIDWDTLPPWEFWNTHEYVPWSFSTACAMISTVDPDSDRSVNLPEPELIWVREGRIQCRKVCCEGLYLHVSWIGWEDEKKRGSGKWLSCIVDCCSVGKCVSAWVWERRKER